MAVIKYNETQIKELKRNKYVKNVTNKNITFSLECKLEIVKLSKKGIFHKDIFTKLGFPSYVVNSEIPRNTLNRLKNNLKKGKIEEKKGRVAKEKIDFNNMTKDEELEYLRAKVALYEEFTEYIKTGLP